MQRSKTQRKRVPPTASASAPDSMFTSDTVVKATEDSLDAFFACESAATFNQTWQKLDRGSRLDRLRKFVTTYPGSLTAAERAALLSTVLKAFELRQLNTKVAIEYDPASATITSIRGLRERITLSGLRTYRIDPPTTARVRTTIKRKATEATTTLTGNALEAAASE